MSGPGQNHASYLADGGRRAYRYAKAFSRRRCGGWAAIVPDHDTTTVMEQFVRHPSPGGETERRENEET